MSLRNTGICTALWFVRTFAHTKVGSSVFLPFSRKMEQMNGAKLQQITTGVVRYAVCSPCSGNGFNPELLVHALVHLRLQHVDYKSDKWLSSTWLICVIFLPMGP